MTLGTQNKKTLFAAAAGKVFSARRTWPSYWTIPLACGLPQILRGENQVDYRYEFYSEDHNRMEIQTHSVYFEQKLLDNLTAKGGLVYDGISGATPTGTHDANGKVKTTRLKDIRRAGNISLAWRFGDPKLGHSAEHTLSLGYAFSQESDYLSHSVQLGDAIEFNEKNTILQFGVSHNFDSARHADKTTWSEKNSTEAIVSLSQLLSPKDIFTAAITFGNDSGYLSDPYRLAEYHPTIFPVGFNIGVPERRPAHRNKEVLFTSLTHHFNSLNASLEGSYRFYHDSYGVDSHTLGLAWHQWLGKHLIVEPMFRFSEQSAASFYTTTFSGPFTTNPDGYHSSDYRLSNFYSLDFGLQATVVVHEHFRIIGGYHRYAMYGLDETSADMYPQANIFTVGLQFLW